MDQREHFEMSIKSQLENVKPPTQKKSSHRSIQHKITHLKPENISDDYDTHKSFTGTLSR